MTCLSCNGLLTTIWQEGEYSADQCATCGLIQADGPPSPGLYDANYYVNNYLPHAERRIRHFQKLLRMANVSPQPPVLDVGAGVGFFLKALPPELRAAAAAVEPAEYARQLLVTEALAPTVTATLAELPTTVGPFATVTLWDVLAHVPNPAHLLAAISERMAAQGRLIIKTPHHPPRLFQLARLAGPLKKGRAVLHIPAQRFHFTPSSLERLLVDNGFTVEQIQWVNEPPIQYDKLTRKVKEAAMQTVLYLSTRHESFLCVARKQA